MHIYLDFETRSTIPLKKRGLYVYADDPSTRILCMAYALGDGPVKLWHPEFKPLPARPVPDDLLKAIQNPNNIVEAHNANFERVIWRTQLVQKEGWPVIQEHMWRCSAAKAAAHNLPRALDDAAKVMGLPIKKDMLGYKIMLLMCKPRTGSLSDARVWHDNLEDFRKLCQYCRQDVATERELSKRLRDLNPLEQEVFLEDIQMNERGIKVDRPMIVKAINLIKKQTDKLNREMKKLTLGAVPTASQREKALVWFQQNGIPIQDTTAEVVDEVLKAQKQWPNLRQPVIRALQVCRQVNRTSVAKYRSMNYRCSETDHRLRGTLLYHGAGTGRWAGAGIQPHNFPRGTCPDMNMDAACEDILHGDLPWLEALYGDPMELFSSALRGAMVAGPGKDLIVGDYSSIEARALAWHANDEKALENFRNKIDPYIDLATDIYRVRHAQVSKPQRQVGKQAELGLGYGMGAPKFKRTCKKYGIEIQTDFSEEVVDIYREKHEPIVDFWNRCNEAAFLAIKNPGHVFPVNYVKFAVRGGFMWIELPSKRRLAYHQPRLQMRETPWGEERLTVTYGGINAYTKQWERLGTYGGKLVENIVQATARDLMAEAILRMRHTLYELLLSVHDELISEVEEDTGTVQEFEELMCVLPAWATELPVTAEGWRGKRYKK